MRIPEQTISNEEKGYIICNNIPLALSVAVNKDIYWHFVKKKVTEPIVVNKWCTELHIDKTNWPCIYKVYASITDTKLKSFQFKVINNLIPCNLYLSRKNYEGVKNEKHHKIIKETTKGCYTFWI